jgi:hypothetical protein
VLARHLVHRLAAQLKSVGADARSPRAAGAASLSRQRASRPRLERAILLADPGAPITEDLLGQVQESAAAGARRGVAGPDGDFERQ